MNYLPFCGGWYYGGASASETASYYCSWGLLRVAPASTPPTGISGLERWIPRIKSWPNFGRRR